MILDIPDEELKLLIQEEYNAGEISPSLTPSPSLGKSELKSVPDIVMDMLRPTFNVLVAAKGSVRNFNRDLLDFLQEFVDLNRHALKLAICGGRERKVDDNDRVSGSAVAISQLALVIQVVADQFSISFTDCFMISVIAVFFIRSFFGDTFCLEE